MITDIKQMRVAGAAPPLSSRKCGVAKYGRVYGRCLGCHLVKRRLPICLKCLRRLERERPDLDRAINAALVALTAAENAAADYLGKGG